MQFLRKINGFIRGNNSFVLMYHRIGDISVDPWELSVSENNFEQQLIILQNEFNVISVKELLHQINTGIKKNNSICITFDDGYVDNFLKAAPLLKKYNCPSTFFISTGYSNQEKLFWWDMLAEIFLNTRQLPQQLQLGSLDFKLVNNGNMSADEFNLHKQWKWPDEPPTQRGKIYLAVWTYLRPLPLEELSYHMEKLIEWSGIKASNIANSIAMTDEQLLALSSEKLFSVGVHTVNHVALGSQPKHVQALELENNRNYLSKLTDNYLDVAAYPYGNYNSDTLDIMKDKHFKAGFTTEEKKVNSRAQMFELGRFQVKNWTGIQFKEQLNKWNSN